MINNRYTILSEIGQGRSRVFCCLDKYHPGEKYAVKILPPKAGPEEAALFLAEFDTLIKLNHPNIIKASGSGTIQRGDENEFNLYDIKAGCKFIVMEYFDGEEITCSGWIRNEENIRSIISQLCSILLYLHHSNYIYNDFKAENILVSKNSSNPVIKLIDLGFAYNPEAKKQRHASGTSFYLAPEILLGKAANVRSDLFSLGVLLYRLVYDRFPFEGTTKTEIFNSTIGKEPLFPESNYSLLVTGLIKKLLTKDAAGRFGSSAEILDELKVDSENQLIKPWSPVKVFIDRKEKDQLSSYLKDDSRFEVLLLKGEEGAGKSSLLNALCYEHPEIIYIGQSENLISGKQLIEEILFHPFVHKKLNDKTRREAVSFLKGPVNQDTNTFYSLKLLLIKICSEVPLSVIFDDFSSYDTYTMISLTEVVRILQSRKSKVIIADTCVSKVISENIHNVSEIDLQAFNYEQLHELIRQSFAESYPIEELYIILSAQLDLTPGSIYNSIKSMYENAIFGISGERISIKKHYHGLEVLISEQKENYRKILQELSEKERNLLELCAMVSINMDPDVCADILEFSKDEVFRIINQLKSKGILKTLPSDPGISFSSERFKLFIYSETENKSEKHKYIARFFEVALTNIKSEEIARQYQLGGDFDKSYDILWERLLAMEIKDSLKFQREVLLKLSEFPVSKGKIFKARICLSKVLQKLGDNKLCLELIQKYYNEDPSYHSYLEFGMFEGISLIELGETEAGKMKIQDLAEQITDKEMKLNALLYLTYATFDLGQFEDAHKKCIELLATSDNYPEFSGKGHNLLGLIEFYYRNNLENAINEFETALDIYTRADLPMMVAAVEVNIGNIYNIQGDLDSAEQHWKSSLEINSSIGNLDQEAKLLLNLGIHFFDRSDFTRAIKQYKEAQFIFSNLGNRISEGMAYCNLGEVYLSICEYTNSLKSLLRAKEIFSLAKSITELMEVEFLIGKLYFQLGDKDGVETAVGNLQKHTPVSDTNNKYFEYQRFLLELKNILSGEMENTLTNLRSIRESLYSFSNRTDFLSASLLISQILIDLGRYAEAVAELNDVRFEELSRHHIFARAEKDLLLSIISGKSRELDLCNMFEYLNHAYDLIEDQHMSEVTWKILYLIARSYCERGNLNRAGVFSNYAARVLSYIADRIEDPELYKKYLSVSERKIALQRLKNIQEQISCN